MSSLLARLFRRGMSCSDVLEVLQSYLDGETDSNVARLVAESIETNLTREESASSALK